MKGNQQVIGGLNQVLRQSLTLINQYFLHARMLGDMGFERLEKQDYNHSIHAMKEADRLVKRILFLEGLPNL
jgi:bacterioferritin